jgi:transcriptional regulator with XRE-family HTH domain
MDGNSLDELPRKLKSLRLNARMSTRAVAARTGFSQSKISKVENGTRVTTPLDIEIILDALGVEGPILEQLRSDARTLQESRQRNNKAPDRIIGQAEFTTIESACKEVICVEREVIPLWLQTTAYTRLIFDLFPVPGRLNDFMTNKTRRKERSESIRRRHVCIVDEDVLRRPMLPKRQWLEQLTFVEERLRKPGVELAVIPTGTPNRRIGSWWCLDERYVLFEHIGSPSTLVTKQNRITDRLDELDELSRVALWGADALELVRSSRSQISSSRN